MMPSETDFCNSSVEDGIFPNVAIYQAIEVPSYQPDYDYINEYSNTPLVYSWLPIVPGFTQDGFDNLHNFQHLASKFQPLNDSNSSEESGPIPDQNVKYHDYLTVNNAEPKLLNNYTGVEFHELENSCNATLNVLNTSTQSEAADPDLSFTGKIMELKAHEESLEKELKAEEPTDVEQIEAERLLNESFELLKNEDSCKMLYINEKSPDLFDSNGDVLSDEPHEEVDHVVTKSFEDCDSAIVKKLQNSLTGLCPPTSITRFHMPMSEILATYKKNLNDSPSTKTTLKTNSYFVPSNSTEEVKSMEWPSVKTVKCLDVSYNNSTANEDIEMLCMQYFKRYSGAETSSSFNHKLGPSSAKKKIEKLK